MRILTGVGLAIVGMLVLFRSVSDPDFGWHLKYGEYFFEHGRVLNQNIFSYTMPSYRWANSYWLSEAIMYFLYTSSGPVLMSLIFGAVFSFVLGRLIFSVTKSKVAALAVFIGIVALSQEFLVTVRPYFSSFLIVVLVYILLCRPRFTPALPALFLVWANLHADFVLGLFILGVFALFQVVRGFQNRSFQKVSRALVIPAFCFLTTFINPYGASLWQTLLKESHLLGFANVAEWSFVEASAITPFIVMVSFMGLISFTLFVSGKKVPVWYRVVLIVFLILSVKAVYFVRILGLSSVFLLCIFADDFAALFPRVHNRTYKFISLSFVGLVFMVSLQAFFTELPKALDIKIWLAKGGYPYRSVTYIAQTKPSGNMFNAYDWGGYLIWQLPQYKTFIDGRMTSWKEGNFSLINDYMKMYYEPEKNAALIDNYFGAYDVGFVLLKPESPIKVFLEKKGWKTTYADEASAVLEKQ